MITETIFNRFRKNIISEELQLPRGTKSAKIVCHADLDGVTSGITMVQHFIKLGIPKERITVEIAQYGDENTQKDAHTQKFRADKKGQYVAVVDFAKFPKVTPFKIWNSLFEFKGDEKKLFSLFRADYENISQEEFNKKMISFYNIKVNKFTEGTLKKLLEAFKAYTALKKYAEKNKKSDKFKFTPVSLETVKEYSYPLVNPDFVSDHHSNQQGALSGGKTGEIAVESPSEAENLAKRYVHGIWSPEDIKAISVIDSAGYNEEQLKNTVFLEKHFKSKNRHDRLVNLATIVSCIYDNLCKKDRTAASWIVKNSQPSLVSLYSTTLKAAKYNGKRLEYVTALKNGDIEKAKSLLSEIPGELNKKYDRRGNPDKSIMGLEDWRKKNKQDVENAKTGYKSKLDNEKLESIKGKRGDEFKAIRDDIKSKKGKIECQRNFAIFDGNDKRTQYTRYLTVLFSDHGQRQPFCLRRWNGFFQIAKSTLYKGTVDFSVVNKHVLQDIEEFLKKKDVNEKKIEIVLDKMKEANGGHAGGIWSFSGFDEIKAPSKVTNDTYWKARQIQKKNANSEVANRVLADRAPEIEKYEKIKKECMARAINSAINWTNKLYPPSEENLNLLKTSDKAFDYEKDSK